MEYLPEQLELRRITHYNELLRCDASGETMMYGDFYLLTPEGKHISYKYYHQQKEAKRRDEWDNSILERAESQKEYQDALREAEQEYLTNEMLNSKIATKEALNQHLDAINKRK